MLMYGNMIILIASILYYLNTTWISMTRWNNDSCAIAHFLIRFFITIRSNYLHWRSLKTNKVYFVLFSYSLKVVCNKITDFVLRYLFAKCVKNAREYQLVKDLLTPNRLILFDIISLQYLNIDDNIDISIYKLHFYCSQ